MFTARRWFMLCLLATASALSAAEPDTKQTVDLGWCTVVMPQIVAVDEAATFIVTFTKVPDTAVKARLDLHWITSAGENKGVNRSGGSKDITLNTPMEWTVTPLPKEGIGKVLPVLYLSTDGTWAGKVGDIPKLPSIAVKQP